MELGVNSSEYSTSRADLAGLITESLKAPNSKHPTISGLKFKHSVKEVRIHAGENNHIFIRGKDF